MALETRLKHALRRILEHPAAGRPLRKLFWLLYKVTERQHQIAAQLLTRHPYVQKLNRLGGPITKKADHAQNTHDQALVRYYAGLRQSVERLPIKPRISVIVPVYKVKVSYLEECLQSVLAQIYDNWELCIVDDASHDPAIDQVLAAFSSQHADRVKYLKNENNLHISLSTNRALDVATGDYVAFLDHDDRLLPNALGEVVRFINLHGEPDVLYSDECIIDEKGDILGTYHKPDWSPLMHLSVNYTTHLSVYRRTLLQEIGGCRQGYEGAQDHDVMMRAVEKSTRPVVHIPINLYQWRSHQLSTASSSEAKPYAGTAGVKAVQDACLRRNLPATVTFEPHIHHYKVAFTLPKAAPLISIIILSKDSYKLVSACLQSIFTKTTYPNFEVILVDHDSQQPECHDLFRTYQNQYPTRFQTVTYRGPFNFAAMNQFGTTAANGEYYLFLNNDTEVITREWLEELLSVAQLPFVGAVGPKLLYPDRKIQHAGIMGFAHHIAGHVGLGEKEDTLAYFAYLQTTHEVMAVTGACLLIAADKYRSIGGFEEIYVPNGFGDVDFCLKAKAKGYSNIYVPYATLLHKESVTRKVTFELFEHYYMQKQWARDLTCDPYRNPSLEVGYHFRVDGQFRIQHPSRDLFSAILDGGRPI